MTAGEIGEIGEGGGGDGGSGGEVVTSGNGGQKPQVRSQLMMKLSCLHLVILSMNDPTAFWQYSGSLGLFSSRHGAGESGKDAAPTLSSMHRAASLSRVRFILVSIAFFW